MRSVGIQCGTRFPTVSKSTNQAERPVKSARHEKIVFSAGVTRPSNSLEY